MRLLLRLWRIAMTDLPDFSHSNGSKYRQVRKTLLRYFALMRILLVGALGRLGTAFERLLPHHSFLTPTRNELDLLNRSSIFSYVESHQTDVIINCAAYNNVDASETNPAVAFLINAHGTQFLAEAAAKFGMPFIHFSTDYEFDGNKREGYLETDTVCPISQYGMSKAAGTQRALAACPRAYVIRTSHLYGTPGRDPESKKSFVEIVLELASEGKPFSINRAEVSAPTFVDDLVRHVEKYILSPLSNKIASSLPSVAPRNDNNPTSYKLPARPNERKFGRSGGQATTCEILSPGIYHIANDGGCSWLEWAQAIVELSGKDVAVLPRDPSEQPRRPAKRPAFSVLRSTKLPSMRPWKDALAEYLNVKTENRTPRQGSWNNYSLQATSYKLQAIETGIEGCIIEPQPLFGNETAGVLHMLSGGEKNPKWFGGEVLDIYSCFTTEPHSSRGGHYHHKQNEMFLPYGGSVLFLLIDFRMESPAYEKTSAVIIGWDTPAETRGLPCFTFKKDGFMPRLRVPVGVYHALFSLETGFTVVALGSWPYEKDDYVYPDLTPEAKRILDIFRLPTPIKK